MTKEDYIHRLMHDRMAIVYAFYSEKFNEKVHGNKLSIIEFHSYFNSWWFKDQAFHVAFQYFENKFNLVRVYDKNNNFLAIR